MQYYLGGLYVVVCYAPYSQPSCGGYCYDSREEAQKEADESNQRFKDVNCSHIKNSVMKLDDWMYELRSLWNGCF